MSDADKVKYKKQEEGDKARYQKEKVKFEAANPGLKKKGGAGGKKEGPQRPSSAFFFFQADRRDNIKKENPTMSHKDAISVSHITSTFMSNLYLAIRIRVACHD